MRTTLLGGLMILLTFTGCGGRSAMQTAPGGNQGAQDAGLIFDDGTVAADQGQEGGTVPGKVTVVVDSYSGSHAKAYNGTVFNGTTESIFLDGCGIFSREVLQGSAWVDKNSSIDCFWEGVAREVKPGGNFSQQVHFDTPGSWRLLLSYGTGCKSGVPLSQAQCTGKLTARSKTVTVTADKATCQQMQQTYKTALDKAKACKSDIALPQCTAEVSDGLGCGCPVLVNDAGQLKSLEKKYGELLCSSVMPPCGIKCAPAPKTACLKDRCQPVP